MIKTDFKFELEESILTGYMGKVIEKKLADPKNQNIFSEIREQFNRYVRPLVIWRSYGIKEYAHEAAVLETGQRIGNGPFVDVIDGAREIVVALCTVGKELERKSRELMKGGNTLKGIILDGVASWAVDDIRCQFYNWANEYFQAEKNYRSSTFLSPGESEWDVKDQGTIYHLLDEEAGRNNITLTDSNVLDPFKSLSLAFGVGPNIMGNEGGSNCDLCIMKDRCRFRKMRAS